MTWRIRMLVFLWPERAERKAAKCSLDKKMSGQHLPTRRLFIACWLVVVSRSADRLFS